MINLELLIQIESNLFKIYENISSYDLYELEKEAKDWTELT